MTGPSLFDDPALDGAGERPVMAPMAANKLSSTPPRRLIVEADGGARGNPGPAGYGALVREGDVVLAERAAFLGVASNNVAEYSGLIAGLQAAVDIDPYAHIEVRMDSKLVVEQMSGRWRIKHADMQRLARQARAIFDPRQVEYTWIPRAENSAADTLANEAMDTGGHISRDYFEAEPRGDTPLTAVEPNDAEDSGRPPLPDLDAGAAGAARSDAVTLVLVSPGMTPEEATDGDPQLSFAGVEIAGAAAALVDRIGVDLWPSLPVPSVLLSSPMVRAQQVAVLLSEATGLGAPYVERDLGPPTAEEERAAFAERVTQTLDRVTRAYPGQTIVLAAHAIIVAAVAGTVMGLDAEGWELLRVAPGTISVVRCWPGGGEIHVLGCPAQLTAADLDDATP
ncbi:MAG TPA: reverse transcriptase-like protein [Actinomycetaceae bacterium]|nr:reverse transcriptase-like protein [Actinomycetaceae bacterium]